jgi:hypothetical protein
MLHSKNIPLNLWAEAVACAVYTLNRVVSRTAPLTPYYVLYKTKPDLSNLRVFGSTAYVHIPAAERQKLDPKSVKCLFIGYCSTQKAHRFWDPVAKKVKISRDAIFDEYSHHSDFLVTAPASGLRTLQQIEGEIDPFAPSVTMPIRQSAASSGPREESTSSGRSDDIIPMDTSTSVNQSSQAEEPEAVIQTEDLTRENSEVEPVPDQVPVRRYPLRIREPTRLFPALQSAASNITEVYEPTDYSDAVTSPEATLWKETIAEEHNSLMVNNTWTLTPLPSGRDTIKTRWIFKVKPGTNGQNPRYKARLVAKGFSQRPGIDFTETYAPVVKMDSLRTVLSLVAARDLDIMQLDIKTAFLYGEVDEEIYLSQPEGFVAAGKESLVCRLNKCLYGLKQAPRVWNNHFDSFLQRFGLQVSDADPCIYLRQQEDEFTIMTIWVDDGLICSNKKNAITEILEYLQKHFEMRSHPVEQFVGLSITRDRREKKLYISQPQYVRKILEKFHMADCNPRCVPADPNSRLSSKTRFEGDDNLKAELFPYREAVGSLLYLTTATRPDIAFAVSQVAQHSENPDETHWAAVKRIFAYLKGTSSYGLCFNGNINGHLIGYTDSDYAGDPSTRRSTTGFIFLLNGAPIAWCSRRQTCVSLSTTEAEFVAASESAKEAVWIRRLLGGFGTKLGPLTILCDNQSAIRLVKNPEFHQRTKHIDVKYYFIRNSQEAGEIDISYVNTEQQLADLLTKPLANPRFTRLREEIGIVAVPEI